MAMNLTSNHYVSLGLDDLDLALIAELESDANKSISELAKRLFTNRHTIDRKLQRLLDEQIIRIVALPDPLALGFKTQAWIGINTLPSEVNSVAREIGRFRAVRHVHINAGRYDVHAWTVFEKPEDLSNFVRGDLASIKGLTNAETMVNLKMWKGFFGLLTTDPRPFRDKPPSKRPDTLDMQVIRELRRNPRQSHIDLAEKVGSSPTTVWRRLKKLLDKRTVRIVAMTNPVALGYTTRATVAINAKPDSIEAIADKLSSYVTIHGVVINTGRFDILAWGDFRDAEDLSNFVTQEMGQIPGLIRHETMVTLKVTKDDFLFEVYGE